MPERIIPKGEDLPKVVETSPQLPTLSIDTTNRTVSINGFAGRISWDTDWQILLILASKPKQDIPTQEIRETIGKVDFSKRQVGDHIVELRKLIEEDYHHPTTITRSGWGVSATYRLNAYVQIVDGSIVVAEQKGDEKDLGEKEEKAVHALFALRKDREEFEYLSILKVMGFVYGDKYSGISNPKEKERITNNHVSTIFPKLRKAVIAQLKGAWTLPLDMVVDRPRLAKAIRWLKGQPEYANLSLDELILVVERKISFEELTKKINTGQI